MSFQGRKKVTKMTAVLLALIMAVFSPIGVFADTVEAEADSIEVKMTINMQGVLASTDDGDCMLDKIVEVVDLNKDGSFTYDEALIAAHEQYNTADGYVTTDTEYGKSVTKLWGVENEMNYLFLINGMAGDTVDKAAIQDGDKLYASVNAKGLNGLDVYTEFEAGDQAETVNIGDSIELTLKGRNVSEMFAGTEAKAIAEVAIGQWVDGEFKSISYKTTDAEGKVSFKLYEEGEYYITAEGDAETIDYSGNKTIAPIMAPGIKIKVVSPGKADSVKVTMTVNNQGLLAKCKDGSAMVEKEVTVEDLNEDGILTYDEALTAAHTAYYSTGVDGYIAVNDPDQWIKVTRLWGEDTSNTLFFINDQGISSSVFEDTVKEGDDLYASVNADIEDKDVRYNDVKTSFDKTAISATGNDTITLTLSGRVGMSYDADKALEGVSIGFWEEGEFVALEGAVTDASGNVSFAAPGTKGTYLITAAGTAAVKNYLDKEIQAPIMAPYCILEITKDYEPEDQTLTVTKKAKTFKAKALKKKKKSVKIADLVEVSGAKTSLSYSAKPANKKSKKVLNCKKNKVIIKKGAKKGTYKVKVTVKAEASSYYKAATKTVTVSLKVK